MIYDIYISQIIDGKEIKKIEAQDNNDSDYIQAKQEIENKLKLIEKTKVNEDIIHKNKKYKIYYKKDEDNSLAYSVILDIKFKEDSEFVNYIQNLYKENSLDNYNLENIRNNYYGRNQKKSISFGDVGDVKIEKIHKRINNSVKPKEDNNENNDFFPSNNNCFGSFPQGSYSDPINSKYQNDLKMDDFFSNAINNLYHLYDLFKKQKLSVQIVIVVVFGFVVYSVYRYLDLKKNVIK